MTEQEIEEYEVFCKNNEKGHLMQSVKWAKLKDNWKNEIIVIREETSNKIIGGMSILIRKLPLVNFTIMYAPRGPVCDVKDIDTLKRILEQCKILAKKHKSILLKMDPDISYENERYREEIKKLDIKISKRNDYSSDVQARFVFRLNIKNKTEEEVFSEFHSKTKYNIRLATKKGVKVRIGTYEDLGDFYEVLKVTGERDKFDLRPFSYFQKMYKELSPYIRLYLAEYDGKVIAGALTTLYGKIVLYIYGASSNEYRNVMPNYLMQWEMIKWGIENKCDIYDFRGASAGTDRGIPLPGLCRFKIGFNAKLVEFVGNLDYEFNPVLCKAFGLIEKARGMKAKTIYNFKNSKEKNNEPTPTWDDYRDVDTKKEKETIHT